MLMLLHSKEPRLCFSGVWLLKSTPIKDSKYRARIRCFSPRIVIREGWATDAWLFGGRKSVGLYCLKREKSKESCVSGFIVEMGMYAFFSLKLVCLGQINCNKKAEPKLRTIFWKWIIHLIAHVRVLIFTLYNVVQLLRMLQILSRLPFYYIQASPPVQILLALAFLHTLTIMICCLANAPFYLVISAKQSKTINQATRRPMIMTALLMKMLQRAHSP